ncbi:hypothetical protein BJI67_02610 [Acidihalobacter aeolianus]|uniref:DUF4089 domain-containing protein n=1 Tax=Acidihalobacter aeolianus TaxID=2792603 RepID=A0A1D8K571_9GAMM|nr:DUF4089 domain-containing protein [Acidihalobacter aeolianus]AOV16105.1 hypothetical protein BJI67_02610 [Acidihalobacter aeolianus]
MTLKSSAEIEAYVDQAAALVDLPIDPAYREMVLTYFALSARMAEALYAQPLPMTEEPAPVFEP